MERSCNCDNCVKGTPFVATRDCRLCWLYWHDQRYAAMWGNTNVIAIDTSAKQTKPGIKKSSCKPCVKSKKKPKILPWLKSFFIGGKNGG